MYAFPTSETDNGTAIKRLLGSHWTNVYEHGGQVRALTETHAFTQRELLNDHEYGLRCMSRDSVPIYKPSRWKLLTLSESKLNGEDVARSRYGDGRNYGEAAESSATTYGGTRPLLYAFPVPTSLRSFVYLSTGVVTPGRTWFLGVDVLLDVSRAAVIFRDNPFLRSDLDIRDVYKDGVRVDREILLWMFRPDYEEHRTYLQYGYVVGPSVDSSVGYRAYVNALWDTLVEGASQKTVQTALAAVCDAPLAKETETVQHIVTELHKKTIITDKNVYFAAKAATISVAVGDTLYAGQSLTDALTFFDFHRGQCPNSTDLPALEWGRELLPPAFSGGLVFLNQSLPVSVDTSGVHTRLEFSISGLPADIRRFWDLLHAAGEATPPTLPQLLDVRNTPVGEPVAESLPSEINPLRFLAENVFRNHLQVARIRLASCGPSQLDFGLIRKIRREMSPHTLLLLIVELAVPGDSVSMTTPESAGSQGVTDSPILLSSLSVPSESVLLTVEDSPRLIRVGPHC